MENASVRDTDQDDELGRISDIENEHKTPKSKRRRKISTESQTSVVKSISLNDVNKFKRPKPKRISSTPLTTPKNEVSTKKLVIKNPTKGHKRRPSYSDQDILRNDQEWSRTLIYILAGVLLSIPFIFLQISAKSSDNSTDKANQINVDYDVFNRIVQRYPEILGTKDIKAIRARLRVMSKQVSILMLLGRFRDIKCKSDPTFCIGQTLSNITQFEHGYIDGSNPKLNTEMIEQELANSLGGERYSIMIDSLEKLPGSEVMSLFQFIDKDESNKRKGLLILTVYSDSYLQKEISTMKPAAIAEKILTDSWSPHVPKDTLTSVISRLSGTIVKILR